MTSHARQSLFLLSNLAHASILCVSVFSLLTLRPHLYFLWAHISSIFTGPGTHHLHEIALPILHCWRTCIQYVCCLLSAECLPHLNKSKSLHTSLHSYTDFCNSCSTQCIPMLKGTRERMAATLCTVPLMWGGEVMPQRACNYTCGKSWAGCTFSAISSYTVDRIGWLKQTFRAKVWNNHGAAKTHRVAAPTRSRQCRLKHRHAYSAYVRGGAYSSHQGDRYVLLCFLLTADHTGSARFMRALIQQALLASMPPTAALAGFECPTMAFVTSRRIMIVH